MNYNHQYQTLYGIPIHITEAAGRYERKQLKFPSSKSKRIRNKWRKKYTTRVLVEPQCFRLSDVLGIFGGGEYFVMHPKFYEGILKEMTRATEVERAKRFQAILANAG